MKIDKGVLLQFFRYLGVGGSTALLYFCLIFVTVQLLRFDHFLAVSVSYLCAISFHFLGNKIFTFRSRNDSFGSELVRYIIVALFNYLVTLAILYVVVDCAHQSTYLAALLAIAVTVGLGYGFTKFWVFSGN